MTAGSANATQFPMMFIVYGGGEFRLTQIGAQPEYGGSVAELINVFFFFSESKFFLMFAQPLYAAPFLLAYLTILASIAMPIMHLESGLAQFSGDGNRGIFSTVPLFMGTQPVDHLHWFT